MKRSLKDKLRIYWRQQRIKLPVDDLISIVRTIEHLWLRKKALIEFLERDNLTFDDFYHMLNLAKDILEENEGLGNRFWEKYLALSTPDHLLELTEMGEGKAAKELFSRIEKETIGKNKARQILIRLFEKTRDKDTKKSLWGKIKDLNPSQAQLRDLLNLKGMYEYRAVTLSIEKFLRKLGKGRKEKRIIKRLRCFVKRITEQTKKELS